MSETPQASDLVSNSTTNPIIDEEDNIDPSKFSADLDENMENVHKIFEEKKVDSRVSDFFGKKGGSRTSDTNKEYFKNKINKISEIYTLFQSDLLLSIVALLSNESIFNEMYMKIFPDQEIGKNPFVKLFFIEINNYPEIRKILNIPNKISRDTFIYNLHIPTTNTEFIFSITLLEAIHKKIYTEAGIDTFFKNFTIVGEFTKLILLLLKKIEIIKIHYETLKTQNKNIKHYYNDLINKNKKVFTFVRERNDNRDRNPRYKIMTSKSNSLLIRYYNTDYRIEKKDDLTKLRDSAGGSEYYYFGPFDGVYLNDSKFPDNASIANNISNILLNKLIDEKQNLCIIGYGQSGSGKTSTLIYLKTDDTTSDGILIELCKQQKFKSTFVKIKLEITNIYVYHGSGRNRMEDIEDKEYKIHQMDSYEFIPDSTIGWAYLKNTSQGLGVFINSAFENREIEPTPNNPNSSRSHVIVCLSLYKSDTDAKPIKLIICDLAGVENVFACEDKQEILKFDERYTVSDKYKDIDSTKEISFDKYFCEQSKSYGATDTSLINEYNTFIKKMEIAINDIKEYETKYEQLKESILELINSFKEETPTVSSQRGAPYRRDTGNTQKPVQKKTKAQTQKQVEKKPKAHKKVKESATEKAALYQRKADTAKRLAKKTKERVEKATKASSIYSYLVKKAETAQTKADEAQEEALKFQVPGKNSSQAETKVPIIYGYANGEEDAVEEEADDQDAVEEEAVEEEADEEEADEEEAVEEEAVEEEADKEKAVGARGGSSTESGCTTLEETKKLINCPKKLQFKEIHNGSKDIIAENIQKAKDKIDKIAKYLKITAYITDLEYEKLQTFLTVDPKNPTVSADNKALMLETGKYIEKEDKYTVAHFLEVLPEITDPEKNKKHKITTMAKRSNISQISTLEVYQNVQEIAKKWLNIYVNQLDSSIKKLKEWHCEDIRYKKLEFNCKLRRNEGYMINKSLADMRKDIKSLIMQSLALDNTQYLPIVYDKQIFPYCRNISMEEDIFDSFYENNKTSSLSGIILNTIKNTYNIDVTKLNFVIFTVINLTNNLLVNNPPNPPYININKLYYHLEVKYDPDINKPNLTNEIENVFLKSGQYSFYNNNSQLQKLKTDFSATLDYDAKVKLGKDILALIRSNNASTLIGSLESTDILQNITFDKVVCSYNDSLKKLLTKFKDFDFDKQETEIINGAQNITFKSIKDLNQAFDPEPKK